MPALTLALAVGAVVADGAAQAAGTLYVSEGGNDAGDCSKSDPCKSFERVYDVARPGQVVEVAAGSYPPQKLPADSEKESGTSVVFQPAPGADVRVPERVDVFASNVVFRGSGLGKGFVFGSWSAKPGSRNLTFEQVNTGIFSISGAKDITVRGGQVGPWAHGSDSQVTSADGRPPTNILIDGVYFHDIQRESPDDHIECLQFGAGENVVIQNSRFVRCSDHDVFIRSWGTPADRLANFTLQNNFFGRTTVGFYTGQFSRPSGDGGTCDGFKLRDNVLEQSWTIRCAPPNDSPATPEVSGNYWAFPEVPSACGTAGVWRSNIYEARPEKPCDPTAKFVPAARELPLFKDDALRRIRGIGFRCGTPVGGERTSAVVCALSGKRFAQRIVVVGGPSGKVKLVTANVVRRSGSTSDAAPILGRLAAMPFQGRSKRVERATRFVSRWLGESADAKIGAVRLRVYTSEDDLNLLISPH